jgi:hypothetical protein
MDRVQYVFRLRSVTAGLLLSAQSLISCQADGLYRGFRERYRGAKFRMDFAVHGDKQRHPRAESRHTEASIFLFLDRHVKAYRSDSALLSNDKSWFEDAN